MSAFTGQTYSLEGMYTSPGCLSMQLGIVCTWLKQALQQQSRDASCFKLHTQALWNLQKVLYGGAGEKEELQSVLNAALSRLEAAIGAAQSQEARAAYLAEQASAAAGRHLAALLWNYGFCAESA